MKTELEAIAVTDAWGHFMCNMVSLHEAQNYSIEQLVSLYIDKVWEPLEGYDVDTVASSIEALAKDFLDMRESMAW